MIQTLYHGSKSGIVGVIRPMSRASCDFGRAFYMGESTHQPLTLICRAEAPKLYTLEFDDTDLVVRDVGSDALWALFVAYNRGELARYDDTPLARNLKDFSKGVDVLRGRIANDRVFQTVQMFFERTITLETLGEVLKAVNLGTQVCAVSARACERIRIVDERNVTAVECESLRLQSESQRSRAFELTDRIVDSRRRSDGIYFDELCEQFRSGEGLC